MTATGAAGRLGESGQGLAKATEATVREMRRRAAGAGRSVTAELAAEYGLTPGSVRKIVRGATWKHVV